MFRTNVEEYIRACIVRCALKQKVENSMTRRFMVKK